MNRKGVDLYMTEDNTLSGIDAVRRINSILASPCDGRDIDNNAVAYIDLLQEAYLYLYNEKSTLVSDITNLMSICETNNINITEFNKKYNVF